MKQKNLWRLFLAAESSLWGLRWSGEKLCVGSEVFLDGQNLPKIMPVHRIFVLTGFLCRGMFFLSSLFHPPYSATSLSRNAYLLPCLPSLVFSQSRSFHPTIPQPSVSHCSDAHRHIPPNRSLPSCSIVLSGPSSLSLRVDA